MGYAILNGFAIVIERSSKNTATLVCSQGGEKRSHKAGGWAPEEGHRTLRTKKTGCTYEIKLGKQQDGDALWVGFDVNDTHSGHRHLSPSEISALPSARKDLMEKHGVASMIEERCASGIEPSVVWLTLRAKFPWLVYKDVGNVRAKLKKKKLNGLTEIEALHAKLKDKPVVSDSLRDDDNRLVRLFFAPNSSSQLTHRYPDILMDATYKTNAHLMPLLHVVGVTGTRSHFTVACCFMEAET